MENDVTRKWVVVYKCVYALQCSFSTTRLNSIGTAAAKDYHAVLMYIIYARINFEELVAKPYYIGRYTMSR